MINRNLSFMERTIRFVLGVIVILWAINQPEQHMVEWLAAIAGLLLLLNAFFGRCYLWLWLKLDSCQEIYEDGCTKNTECD